MGVAVIPVGLEADLLHEFYDTLLDGCLFNSSRRAMDPQRFAYRFADGESRVEGRVGVLEDDLHLGPQGAHLAAGEGVQGTTPIADAAVAVVDET